MIDTDGRYNAAGASLAEMIQSESDALDRAQEQAYDATRHIRDAIRDLPGMSDLEVAAILACLSHRVTTSGWSHTEGAKAASELIDSAHDELTAQGEMHA